ncbi:MAG: AAA family ATPase [Acidobacteriia bacterium]|nr:AAA family ATPase [Terriglobia bacterium]
MRITKIEVSDFRGFPGPAVYDFEFKSSRNLFIYGENGSGKSSLFRAIQEFFNRRAGAKPFADYKNNLDMTLTSGRVTVHFDNGQTQSWVHGGARPLGMSPASQTALQSGFLDYRSLLETNFAQRGEEVNLFDIAITRLVPHLEKPTAGGGSRRIGELWSAVHMPRIRRKRAVDACMHAVSTFNTAFEPVIKPLIEKATELLGEFPIPVFILGASFQPVEYDSSNRKLLNLELILSVQSGGTQFLNFHNVLNEARLSAIGLVIYLAGLLISVPATTADPKLLVLDDVLVGLDMANRVPVLKILEQYFTDWQIILLTHDRVWYEMVQLEMENQDWRAYELWLAEDGVTPVHRSRDGGPNFFLDRANKHLADNDDRAAAVYARAAFEAKVRKYCSDKYLPVPYNKDPRKVKAESLWKAATKHALEVAPNPAEKRMLGSLFRSVYAAKQVVLNPLSHSITQPITKPEIQAAILAVSQLVFH